MRRIFFVLACFLFSITQSSFAQTDTILNRYRQYLLQSAEVESNIQEVIASLNTNWQWSDLNYKDTEPANWQLLIHLKRVKDLALAWANPRSAFYGQEAGKKTIDAALDHWLKARYKSSNWWHNEIGVPQQIRDIIILMQSKLSPAQLKGALEVLAQYHVYDNTVGANLTWSADLGFHYGLLTGDLQLMKKCRDLMVNEIKITTGEGVQPDYSFHQHGSRLQMYQYGKAFLWENVRIAWQLRGTELAFPQEKINILSDFALQGWQWMAKGIHTVPGTMDRSASRKNALHSADMRPLIPYFIELVPSKEEAFKALLKNQNDSGALNGFRYYPYSDFTAYQQKNFSFFLKTISNRTLSTESINNENLKGHLLNSGDAYLIRDGQEYYNLMPVWNWEYLPGVTSFKGADRIKRKPFVGSVGDSSGGFTSMDYLLESNDGSRFISAKKSWFCYDNKIVCLVADLKGKGVDSVYTVMDQCRWMNQVVVNKKNNTLAEGDHFFESLKWVHHRNFVYVPLTSTPAEIQLRSVTGKWTTINASESDEPVREKVFMPVLLHYDVSKENSFAYLMTSGKTPVAAKRFAKHPGCKIIRNDSLCQAVMFKDGTTMVAFFEPGSVDLNKSRLSVDKACLILIRDNRMYASDPQQLNSSVVVEFSHKTFNVQLPRNGFSTEGLLVK